ncbi:hypothetical protein AB7294_04125 [Cylindrospermopsis raciborskii UAM/DH-MRr]|uniref:hypothetical protein n=1 Tax=Cylindrospermopsis raciborskii TaxID=77022 RepID=UPI003879A9C4
MSTIKQADNFSAKFGEVLRSSSIFWITQNSNTKTTISLSNYWQFKNNLDVTILVSWRSMRGELLKRHKVEFEFFNVLNLACPFDEFEGSCEIETFCLNNLRIPYSAIMAVYETKDSISMVHSYTRTYSLPNTVPIEERWLHHVATALAPNDKSPSIEKFDVLEIRKVVDEMGFEKSLDFFTGKCNFDPNRPGNHISWWTHQKIFGFLQRAGFSNIYRSGYGQSVSPILRNTKLFDSTHPQMSIYVECIK